MPKNKKKYNGLKKSMFVVRYRWWIISVTFLITILSIIPIFNIRINSDFETYFPDSMQSRVNNKKINKIFGEEEPIMILFSTSDVLNAAALQRVENLTNAFGEIQGIKRVFSLFKTKNITSEDGAMIIDPVVKKLPEDEESREKLRHEIKANDLAWKLVVSEDFKNTLIILSSDKTIDDKTLLHAIKEKLNEFPGSEEVNITGQPFLRDDANRRISRDLLLLLPLGIILMFTMLWISFREFRGVFLPLSVVVFSILLCLGLLPLLGWKLSLVGILIPVIMIAVANNYGVYLVARYQDLNASLKGTSIKKIVQMSVKYLFTPVLFCGLTTIAGILGLAVHLLIPARQVGVITAIGIAYALLLSLLFIPAVMSLLKNGKPHKDLSENATGFYAKGIQKTASVINKKPKIILTLFIAFFIAISFGMIYLKVAPDSNNVMPAKSQFNKAVTLLDNQFGGSKMMSVMIKGDARNPEILHQAEIIELGLRSMKNTGAVMGLPTILRKMSCALNDSSSPEYGKIPNTSDAISQYLELYSMSGDPADLEQFVDFGYENMLLSVQFKAKDLKDIDNLTDSLNHIAKSVNAAIVAGGYSLVEKEMSRSILVGQIYSLVFAFLAILVLLSFIFKSFTAGLMGSIPLVFAVFSTFGLMGWFGIELDIVTALLSSISIGLGVDFTIHIFWRIKWELARGNNHVQSITNTLKTIGRGIVINAFSVMIGFSILFVSVFPIIRSFAILINISLLFCLVSALVLIPALCLLIKPKFLSRK